MRSRTIAVVLVLTVGAMLVMPPAASAQGPHRHHGPSTAEVVTGVILGGLLGYLAVKTEPWDERWYPPPPPRPVYAPYPSPGPCVSCGPYPAYQPLPTRPLPTPGPYPLPTQGPSTGYTPSGSGQYGPPPADPYGSVSSAPLPSPAPDGVDARFPDATPAFGTGTLMVRVQPLDADVVVDGELWNRSTGQERFVVTLPAGAHRIDIRKPGYVPFGTDVTVKAGESTTFNVSLNAR